MIPTVRFAPSPTGFLHIGNARTALLNALFARKNNGQFILRLDDTDQERSKKEYADAIVVDLAWLGISPNKTVAQSERLDLYHAAVATLKAQGRLYPCYETADELDRKRKRQLARGLPPVYDRAALNLTADDIKTLEAEGKRPHWRFKLNPGIVAFDDLVRGRVEVDAASLSDPVLVREDGSYLYTLPSVVDDVEMNITHIIRGEDHVFNTGVQIQIFEALGAKSPIFAHHNLLTNATGEGLSKRTGSLSLHSLRDKGLEPMAVASLATLTGSSDNVVACANLDVLAEKINLSHISHSSSKFDPSDLGKLNAQLMHEMPFEEAAPRLKALGITEGEAFWNCVRKNLEIFSDAKTWFDILHDEKASFIEDADFITTAATLLPAAPYSNTTWKDWTNAVKEKTGRKGKDLFMPLRLALTGKEHGPEMTEFLPLMSPTLVATKLRASR